MIKGIIFDVDGVILDSMSIWPKALQEFFDRNGIEGDEALQERILTKSFKGAVDFMRDTFDLNKDAEEVLEELFAIALEYYENDVELKGNVRSYLEGFRRLGLGMAVATASDRSYIEKAFSRLGISDYFDSFFTCREVGREKTEPLIYDRAAESLGLTRNEVVVFEDSLYAIQTCSTAGFKVAAVADEVSRKDEEEIRSLADIYLENYDCFDLFLETFNL